MVEERRRASRVQAYRPLRLRVPKSERVVETLTKDLATDGIRCVSTMPFPVSTELDLELVLSTGFDPVVTRGKTVWFRLIPHSEQFDIGIAFVEISEQDKIRLSAYIDGLSVK